MILLAYGAFSILSHVLAGKIASYNGISKLRFVFIVQAIILGSLFFTMQSTVAGLISIMLMAAMIYVMNATVQLYLMNLASLYFPGSKDFAFSLTPVAVNIGIALGAPLGGGCGSQWQFDSFFGAWLTVCVNWIRAVVHQLSIGSKRRNGEKTCIPRLRVINQSDIQQIAGCFLCSFEVQWRVL